MTTLPSHPHLKFRQITKSFAKENVPLAGRHPFLWTMALWRKVFSIDQAETLIANDFAHDRDGFFHEDWLLRHMFYPQVSAIFVAEVAREDIALRAAQVIAAAISFYLDVTHGRLEQEYIGNHLQDMTRYEYFFSRPMISKIEQGNIFHRITPMPASDYIVVWKQGQPFKLNILEDGHAIENKDIYASIKAILNRTDKPKTPPIGLLTVSSHKESIHLWEKVSETNQEAIETLNKGLFAVALDADSHATDLNTSHSAMHSGNYANRDWRQTLQIIITGSGQVGLVVNPYPGIGGTLSAHFTAEIAKRCQIAISSDGSCQNYLEPIPFRPVNLDDTSLRKQKKSVERRFYRQNQTTSFEKYGIGFVDLKRLGISPGSAMVAALSLAWYRVYAHVPTMGSFINYRNFKHGDIWRYNTSSPALNRFTLHPSRETYQEAEMEYRKLVRYHKQGTDAFYQGAMSLKRLISDKIVSFYSFVSLMAICSIFVKRFSRQFMNPNIWISAIPAYDGMKAIGRPGSTMDYLGRKCMGGHYMLFADHFKLCLLSPPAGKHLGTEATYAEAVSSALKDIVRLHESPSVPQKIHSN